MNSIETPFEQLLFEHRISPPPAFSAGVNAALADIMRNESRATQIPIHGKKRKSRGGAKRVLLLVASFLIILAISVMAIPSARAAVSNWIGGYFSAGDYLGKTGENRNGEPALDSIIRKIEPDGRELVISDILNTEQARQLANDFGICLDEITYTGDAVYITGWLTGTSAKFILDQRTGGDTVHEDSEYTEGIMRLTFMDGTVYSGMVGAYFDDEMEKICSDCPLDAELIYDAQGNLATTNALADSLWYAYLKTHEVRFVMAASPETRDPAATKLTGQTVASLSFQEFYHDAKTHDSVTLFRADLGTVTIDADAYSAVSNESALGQSVSLSGIHRMFMQERDTLETGNFVRSYVVDLDMTGVQIQLQTVTFTPTGLEVALRMKLPENWSREERIAAMHGGENGGIGFAVLLDGQEIQHAFATISNDATGEAEDDPFFTGTIVFLNSTLSRSQWDAIKTISFIPYTGWPTELILEDLLHDRQELDRITMDPGVVVTEEVDVTGTRRVDWIVDRMDDFALTISLDDYRP